jgi:hypothetical protein
MYNWIIYLHITAAFAFLFAHGGSAFASLRLRRETNLERIRALLELSSSTLGVMYVALIVILLTGIGGGFIGSWWGRGWIWASLVLLFVVIILMYARGSRYYAELRAAAGLPAYGKPTPQSPKSEEELAVLLKSPRPFELTAIGGIGLLALLYLMVFKPF